jgi:tetratricopeptide (TPR) repeat protein
MRMLSRERCLRRLSEAEGFLLLDLPARALAILATRAEWPEMPFEASLLHGEALRALGRHGEALRFLEFAAAIRPDDIGVALALGWCYKRTHRLAQAIDALRRARDAHPEVALLHYNLACYWSLAASPRQALDALAEALRLDEDFRARIKDEPDFDPIRNEPDFLSLMGANRAQA